MIKRSKERVRDNFGTFLEVLTNYIANSFCLCQTFKMNHAYYVGCFTFCQQNVGDVECIQIGNAMKFMFANLLERLNLGL
jgi:hypothetical protein